VDLTNNGQMCETQVPNADKVLMVASAGYFRCYDQTELPSIGLGAACETTVIRNTLYECHYISDKFRFVYFDKAHLTGLPIALKGMQQFDANNPDDMRTYRMGGWHDSNRHSNGCINAHAKRFLARSTYCLRTRPC